MVSDMIVGFIFFGPKTSTVDPQTAKAQHPHRPAVFHKSKVISSSRNVNKQPMAWAHSQIILSQFSWNFNIEIDAKLNLWKTGGSGQEPTLLGLAVQGFCLIGDPKLIHSRLVSLILLFSTV